jgi:lysophospholipase L1-like esterase
MNNGAVMAKQKHRARLWVLFRIALIILGTALMLVATFADRLGIGDAGSVGIGQVVLGVIGLFLLLVGALESRFTDFYRGFAIVLLNTVLLVFILELAAIVVGRLVLREEAARIETLPYYASKSWGEHYWSEAFESLRYRYEPYVLWRHLPYSGELVNFDSDGLRPTPGADCVDGAFRVYTFGGSTMLGWGAPDWGTIPAYLQAGLERYSKRPICVVNFAEDGYVSTQSVLELMLQLHSGNVPDVVVLYDGVNDVLAAHESGHPRAHVTLEKIASRFEQREHPLVMWFRSSRLFDLLDRWVLSGLHPPPGDPDKTMSRLTEGVAANFVANQEIVAALSRQLGFDFYVFIQPHLGVGEKPLTEDEQAMLYRMDESWAEIARQTYRHVRLVEAENDRIWDLSGVFDDISDALWIDDTGHITPEGNRLVAEEILRIMSH